MRRVLMMSGLLLGMTNLVWAAPTDIVPRGDTLNDAFAVLARAGDLTADITPVEFLGEKLHTRGQLAQLLETHLLYDQDQLDQAESGPQQSALRDAVLSLRPELTSDGVDVDAILADTKTNTASLGGYVQPEARVRTGGDSQPGSGAFGIYRATVLGDLGTHFRYVVSASNWAQDFRRQFYNDVGPHDFSALNEAYLEYEGANGLSVRLGQFYDNWGPGYSGSTLLSDNPPPYDQARIEFPFSLGALLGRNYHYTQMLSAYSFNGQTIYYGARRIEYAFSPRLNADVQESFLSDVARSLYTAPFPDYYNIENFRLEPFGLRLIKVTGFDAHYNANFNFGLSYDAGPPLRVYGQFYVDDLQSPGTRTSTTPRKIAYLVGAALQPAAGTQLIGEYSYADPTTYSNSNPNIQQERGRFDEIGLPTGPNTRQIFLRASQQITPRLSVALEGRDRHRHDDSFPAPNSRTVDANVTYSLDSHDSLGMTYYDYRQDPFPLAPGVPVGNGEQPTGAEGNYGQRERIQEMDLFYQFFF